MLGLRAHRPETNEDPENNVILTMNICTQTYLIGNELEDTFVVVFFKKVIPKLS